MMSCGRIPLPNRLDITVPVAGRYTLIPNSSKKQGNQKTLKEAEGNNENEYQNGKGKWQRNEKARG